MKRREFLHVIGASGAAAVVGGCARGGGPDLVTPYPAPSEQGIPPGTDVEYATVCRECPAGCGMIARVRDVRAYKVEGNPDHPINHGKLCMRGQAALQGLYNPDRFQQPMARDEHGRLAPISWDQAQARLMDGLALARTGTAAWIGRLESGALDRLIDHWIAAVSPTHRRLRYEALAYEPLRAAHERVFGRAEVPEVRIDRARMILSLGADFLETWVSNVEYTRQFSAWRQARVNGSHRGRYVFIGPRLSLTGQNADEWVVIRPGTEPQVAAALLRVVQAARSRTPVPTADIAPLAEAAGVKPETLERLGREFAASDSPLALPVGFAGSGPGAAEANEAVLRMNVAAGSVGRTLIPGWPHALSATDTFQDMLDLVRDMNAGQVSVLFLHHANPAYDLPPAAGFAEAAAHVPLIISFSSFPDDTTGFPGETGGLASLVLPDHTPLESWGDYTPRDGITGLMQPAVAPVFDTRSTGDVLLAAAGKMGLSPGAANMQQYLQQGYGMDAASWSDAIQRGGIFTVPDTAVKAWAQSRGGEAPGAAPPIDYATSVFADPPAGMAAPAASAAAAPATPPAVPSLQEGQLFLHVYPSLQFFDGRLSNRPWMQEIPDAATKAVWSSWAEVHPDTAGKLGVVRGDLLAIRNGDRTLNVPVYVGSQVHPEAIAIQLGQGRSHSGRYTEESAGVNPLALLAAGADPVSGGLLLGGTPVAVTKLSSKRPIPVLQASFDQNSTEIARAVKMKEMEKGHIPGASAMERVRPHSLYSTIPPKEHPKSNHKWGMTIDLDRCVGCNACVAACYAENNVPIVGKKQSEVGREMSWLRIETYYHESSEQGHTDSPDPAAGDLDIRFFPMVCMQCDNAPCEYVCPVNATEHNDEGLNMQVYNRCVGTRFCSNNCPYKVRRFNWYTFPFPAPLDQQLNPDVIHRTKGVMEKCSFCIQRIRRTEINAGAEHRPIRDGEIQTACMQTCPADAIIFGDQKDPASRVHRSFHDAHRGYGALEELNTYPNVQYLERVRVEES